MLNLGTFDIAIHIAFDNNKILKNLKEHSNTKVVEFALVSGLPHYLNNLKDWLNYIQNYIFLSKFPLMKLNEVMKRIVSWFYMSSLCSKNIVSISEYDRLILKNGHHLDVHYIPPVHNFGECLSCTEEPNSILFFSGKSMASTIAVEYLLVAAKMLPEYNFYITGFIPRNATNFQNLKNIKMCGYIEENKFYELITRISLIVMPLVSGSGFQTKLAESLMRAKPVITTSVIACEFPGLLNMEHIIVEDNPHEFTNKIKMLMNDKQLRMKLSRNAKKYYDSYLTSDIALKLHQEYLEKLTRT
jgi:glycosyltransferase involved in cell wall biosynthesis